MATANPFLRGYQDLYIRRELLITDDDNYQPSYRQLTTDQEGLTDEELAGHHCVFGDTHALVIEPEEISEEQDALYLTDGQVRSVVYTVRATENGEELHLGDTESRARAEGLLKRIQFETGFYSRSFEITSAHLPDYEWDDLQDLVQHADTNQLMFECFTLPDSDAVGFKLHGTPWTDEHLNDIEGHGLSVLQAKQDVEGFMPETIRVLGLAGQADVRILILDPNGCLLEGLPLF
ncbi:ABC transporter substrate-binding protein [Pseudomonas benzopyrenica]|uniref:ABC transporter substrate-binding protein n=1 Tax=Pseudomonas benzopyrenica TaxID=2993566 RepID=UPI0039C00774